MRLPVRLRCIASFLVQNWLEVQKKRRAQFSTVGLPIGVELQDNGKIFHTININLKDPNTKTFEDTLQQAANYLDLYYFPKELNKLSAAYGNPMGVYDCWSELIENPMGLLGDSWPESAEGIYNMESVTYILHLDDNDCNVLAPGSKLYSQNCGYYLAITNGVVGLYETGTDEPYWTMGSKTTTDNVSLTLQADGQLVIGSGDDKTVVSSQESAAGEKYYVLVNNCGMLEVRTEKDYSLIWCTSNGVLPADISTTEKANAAAYGSQVGMSFMGGLKEGSTTAYRMYAVGSPDGISWPTPAYYLPDTMLTCMAPAVCSFGNNLITLYKGVVGDDALYLNSSTPRLNSFGGMVIPGKGEVYTKHTPSCYDMGGIFCFLFNSSGNDSRLYFFISDKVDDSDGTLTELPATILSDQSPSLIQYNDLMYGFYKGLGQSRVYFTSLNYGDIRDFNTIGKWLNPTELDASVATAHAPVALVHNNLIYVFYLNSDNNRISYVSWNGKDAWSVVTDLPENVVAVDSPSVVSINNRLLVYYKRSDSDNVFLHLVSES